MREAVQRLAALGYVDVRRGRNGGAFVLQGWGPDAADMIRRTLLPGWDRFERLFDFRQLVEPLIARTAAERRTDEDIARIRATLDAYRAAGTDREASRAADEALHAAIAHATQNPYLANLSGMIRSEISLGFGAEPYSAQIRERAIEHHAALAEAIISGARRHGSGHRAFALRADGDRAPRTAKDNRGRSIGGSLVNSRSGYTFRGSCWRSRCCSR